MDLIEVLYSSYGQADGNSLAMRSKYWRKKYLWKLVIGGGATVVKRLLDIVVSLVMLFLLTKTEDIPAPRVHQGDLRP